MGGMIDLHGECHFGGWYTRLVVGGLRADSGIEGLTEALEWADETRSAEVLSDDSSWSSYEQFRRLLKATARVMGGPSKLTAVGARIAVELADGTTQVSEVYAGSGYYSQSSPECFFGYTEGTPPRKITVRWPSGATTQHDYPPNTATLVLAPPQP